MNKRLFVTAVALAGAAANASTVLNENFNGYTNGTLSGQGGWTATQAAATPMQVAGGADKYVQLGLSGQDEYKAFSSAVPHTDGNGIYTAAKINVASATANGDYFLHLSSPAGTTSIFLQRLFARGSDNGFQLGLLDTSGSGNTTTWGTGVLDFNTDYNVAISWNFVAGASNDTFSLYINPTSATEGDNTTYLTHAWTSINAEPATLEAGNLRQGGNTTSASVQVDNFIVATSFAEVVPEPASLALIGVGGLLLRRRR